MFRSIENCRSLSPIGQSLSANFSYLTPDPPSWAANWSERTEILLSDGRWHRIGHTEPKIDGARFFIISICGQIGKSRLALIPERETAAEAISSGMDVEVQDLLSLDRLCRPFESLRYLRPFQRLTQSNGKCAELSVWGFPLFLPFHILGTLLFLFHSFFRIKKETLTPAAEQWPMPRYGVEDWPCVRCYFIGRIFIDSFSMFVCPIATLPDNLLPYEAKRATQLLLRLSQLGRLVRASRKARQHITKGSSSSSSTKKTA